MFKINKMKLKERISVDYIKAFKEKNAISKGILSVVKSEIQTIEKSKNGSTDLNDEEVIRVLNKLSKSLKETISISNDEKSKKELEIIETYLPELMSEEDITKKVQSLIDSGEAKNMGDFMKAFSNVPADKKLVNKIVNQLALNIINKR